MAVYKRDIIDINLETGNIYRSWLKHSIGYKDQKADHFGVRVFRDGEAVILTGVSVQGVFMPPQGSPIAITSGNIVSGNVAEVVLPQACYNYDGQFTLAIKLVDSTNSVTGTVRIVDGMVDNTHASGTVAPTSSVPTYQEVLSVYEQAITVIGKSVRFDTDQSLTDAQKTTARTNIAAASTGELSDLKSAINPIEKNTQDIIDKISTKSNIALTVETQKRYDVVDGELSVLTGSSYSAFKSAIIDVSFGESYLYSGKVYNYANQYSLIAVDGSNNVYKYELNNQASTNYNDYYFVIPKGATKLIIQSYSDAPVIKKETLTNVAENISALDSDMENAESDIAGLTSDIAGLTSDIAKIIDKMSEKTSVTLTIETQKRYDVVNGELSVLTGSSYNSFKSSVISVSAGEIYQYSGRVYNYATQYSVILIDNSDNVYLYELNYTTDTLVSNYTIVVPTGATKLIVQSYLANPTVNKVSLIDVNRYEQAMSYDNVMRSISRMGLTSQSAHNCKDGFIKAYKAGFKILLCDLRFTADSTPVPVLFHDEYINKIYSEIYDSNNTLVSTSPPKYISDITWSELSSYKRSKTINGTRQYFPIMTLTDMALLVKQLGVELYIECKVNMTSEQAEIACGIIQKYGISDKTTWVSDSVNGVTPVVAKIPSARVGTMPSTINATQISNLLTAKTDYNEVFFFAWNTTTLTAAIVESLIENGIKYEMGTLDTATAIENYFAQGDQYYYCTGIESNAIVAGKAIIDGLLNGQ